MRRAGRLRAGLLAVLSFAVFFMAGCAVTASRPQAIESPAESWSGRLALRVDGEPPQSYAASFTLTGSAQAGELRLTSPLGSTLAVMQWEPGQALLRQGELAYGYASLDELVYAATGADLPVRALFGWLGGTPQAVEGWQADLSRLPDGRLTANRLTPPAAELRVVLDR